MTSVGLCLRLAAMGAASGMLLAGGVVSEQHYLGQGLSRTAVWLLGRGSVAGAISGISAGIVGIILVLVGLALSSRLGRASTADDKSAWFRYLLFLGVASGIAIMVSPTCGGPPNAPPYERIEMAVFGALWVMVLAIAGASRLARKTEMNPDWFRFRLFGLGALAFGAGALHVWVRAMSWRALGSGLFAVLASVVLATALLQVPARWVHDRIGRWLGAVAAGPAGLVVGAAVLLGALGLAGVGAVGRAHAREAAARNGGNMILIGIDTLRYDRASLRSSDERARDLTPNLRRLAVDGTVFSNAYSQAPWTLPSFASMFTGLYPEQHGAEHLTSTLAATQVTIAELLREAGYRTMSVVSCEYLNTAAGMGQGFDVVDESQVRGHQTITSAEITNHAIRLLEQHGNAPFFLFVHYFDPHFSYQDHGDFHFADGYQGRLRAAVQSADQNAFIWLIMALGPAFADRARYTAEDRQFVCDAYDEEVAYTDAQIARLLDYLEQAGSRNSTLVIAVGDHGEELLERNWSGHTTTLYEEQVHVPLVVAVPGKGSAVEDRVVETRAIFDTIVAFCNVRASHRPLASHSLLESGRQEQAITRSSTKPVWPPPPPGQFVPKYVWLTSITDGRWKLIKNHLLNRVRLFDLKADPRELRDLAREQDDRRRALERKLDELDAQVSGSARGGPPPEATDEQKRRLKSLGYL